MSFGNTRIENCPVTNANRARVTIDPRLQEPLIVALYAWKDEFIMFLEGERQGRDVHVTGIHVPEQYNAPSTCESIEKFDPDKWLGILHSHVNFGAFHSCTDEQGVDNAPVSLVLSRKGGTDFELCGKVSVELPCGSNGVLKADVKFSEPATELITEWAAPTTYSLDQAIKSDCIHAYKQNATGCDSQRLVERDFTLYNQISENTKKRSYTVYNQRKGGDSGSSSKSYEPEKKEVGRTALDDEIASGNGTGRSSRSLSGVSKQVIPVNSFKCCYCDEIDTITTDEPIVVKGGYELCYWCADHLSRSGMIEKYGTAILEPASRDN